MIGDYKEKYYRINLDWPGMAGQLEQTLRAQRRLVERLKFKANEEDVKSLIVSVAGSIESTQAMIDWVQKMLRGVGEDAEALVEGAGIRNQLKWNQELLSEMLDAKK